MPGDTGYPFESEGGGKVTHKHQYEMMVIIQPEVDERQVPAYLDKYLKVITDAEGTIENVDIWGKRKFAYEIQKKNEGIYAVVDFTATSEATQELDRQLGLADEVMRTKILRAEEAIAMVASEAKRAEAKAARKTAAKA
ncbi:MAG TPA: 30S ribosomal protein S6 [Microbacterium sp.]|nr:30S ribosomal protein S6 [Microbacterium sp.]